MSLIHCPECGNEVSTEAVACPNCGRPLAAPAPTIQRRVIVAEPRDDGFPKWVIAPIAILGIVVIFLLIAITRNNEDEANRTVNVNLATQRRTAEPRDAARDTSPPNRIDVPSSSTTVNPPAPPPSAPAPSYPSSTTTVPPSSAQTVPVDRASVVIDAKIATGAGAIQSVKNEKFYLLDKDLDAILADADLEPIEGNSLADSFGLAVLYPDRYGDFRRDALAAISKHIKYNATTGGDGRAAIKNVEPDSYYLFGITKAKNAFAVWSAPVSITAGENKLNLQPARLNEIAN
ncbi:MAG: zinc-ribbon domain-containing protein [Acidobacteria bacterium]|nr:zinc-ribbon domain-containing protein [Acidobacteriota bacterium]